MSPSEKTIRRRFGSFKAAVQCARIGYWSTSVDYQPIAEPSSERNLKMPSAGFVSDPLQLMGGFVLHAHMHPVARDPSMQSSNFHVGSFYP
jgi:hypothetical protein